MPTIGEKVSSPWGGVARWLGRVDFEGYPGCDVLLSWYAEPFGREGFAMLVARGGAPISKVSVNVDTRLEQWEFVAGHDFVRDGWLPALLDSGLAQDTERTVDYGFIVGAPVLRLGDAVIAALVTP